MFVVSTDTCPNHALMVLISTPACSRWVAVVWRMVCGDTRLSLTDGILSAKVFACLVTISYTPNRVIGYYSLLTKTKSSGSLLPMSVLSSLRVLSQSGHLRFLLPLPVMVTTGSPFPFGIYRSFYPIVLAVWEIMLIFAANSINCNYGSSY